MLKHPRHWVPPPCLASSPLQNHNKRKFASRKSFSEPNIGYSSKESTSKMEELLGAKKMYTIKTVSEVSSSTEDEVDNIRRSLKQLKKEKALVEEAQLKRENGRMITPLLEALVHKWENCESPPPKNTRLRSRSSDGNAVDITEKRKGKSNKCPLSKRKEKSLEELERSFNEAREEEERLKEELKGLRRETHRGHRSNVKLKRSHCSSSHTDYKYLALKKKYEDLVKYLSKLEVGTKEIYKENEVLRSTLEAQKQSRLGDRISELERELSNRNIYIVKIEKELEKQQSLKEENMELTKVIETLKRISDGEEEDQQSKREHLEKEWGRKINEMKTLYETAIRGYREELEKSQIMNEDLEQKLRNAVSVHDTEEKKAKEESQRDGGDEEQFKTLLQLETIIQEREREISQLRERLLGIEESSKVQTQGVSTFLEQILIKIDELFKHFTDVANPEIIIEPLKENLIEILKGFQDLREKPKEISTSRPEDENNDHDIRMRMRKKDEELKELKSRLEGAHKNMEKFMANAQNHVENDSNIELVKEFTRLRKESDTKIMEAQNSYQSSLIENKILQERLKNTLTETGLKQERIAELEERVKELNACNKKLENELEKMEFKLVNLEAEIEKKDKILEKNSVQLDDRIREYSSMATQIEKQREEHNKEIDSLKALQQDIRLQPRLQELQIQNTRLESELSVLRNEKNQCEKTWRRQVRDLEEQVNNLKFKNTTLQKNLDTIQTTYKAMFSLEGNWNQAVDLPRGPLFTSREHLTGIKDIPE